MRKYVKLMLKISTHYRVKMPDKIKESICKNCQSVLVPGLNAKVRLVSSHGYVAYSCNGCGFERHTFYAKRGSSSK